MKRRAKQLAYDPYGQSEGRSKDEGKNFKGLHGDGQCVRKASSRVATYTDLYIREFSLALMLILPGRLVPSGVGARANSLESGRSQHRTAEDPTTAVGD